MKVVLATGEGESFFGLIEEMPGVEVVRASTNEEILAAIADADVLYGRPTAEMLAAARQLKWIQSQSAGVDFLMKLPELVENDIIITNTRGAHAPAIAEHSFALLLALTRKIPLCLEWQRRREWGRSGGYRLPRELMGSTIGILGYGQIGRAVAQRASGFEVTLLAVDLNPGSGDRFIGTVWPVDRLPDMLQLADVLIVAAPYTAATRHMIDAAAMATMPKGSLLIAVSRGGIVEETALIEALKSGQLAGAGIDVAETEPLPAESPLWDMENVILTHHLAGSSWQKEKRCIEIFVENVQRFQRGEELTNLVDKRAGF